VGLTSPHPRWVVPERFYRMYNLENIYPPQMPGGWPPDLHPVLAAANHYNKFDLAPFSESIIRRARAAYYATITQLDEWVGEILSSLERSGEARNTVVIFTADHGEMLGEHGMWFKGCPYDPAARVPLVIAGPGFEQKTVAAPVSHVDLAATILELAGLEPFPGLRGRSVIPLLQGAETGEDRWTYSELNNEGNITGSFWVRNRDWKYVYFVGYPPLLFNLKDDPGEFENLAGGEKYREVESELNNLLRSVVDPEAVSAAAFEHQKARLEKDLARLDDPDIYRMYSSRLGEEFTARLKAGI
jgi:choline-sulfatase